MSEPDYDIVHTITDWYDGARAGVAGLQGEPHYYENRWDEARDDWSGVYLLQPIDQETFRLALEDWGIWLRWRAAFDEGRATAETHPALPEDRARHAEVSMALAERLLIRPGGYVEAEGEFRYGEPTLVRWTVIT